MVIEIVDFPIKNGLNMVKLSEGNALVFNGWTHLSPSSHGPPGDVILHEVYVEISIRLLSSGSIFSTQRIFPIKNTKNALSQQVKHV